MNEDIKGALEALQTEIAKLRKDLVKRSVTELGFGVGEAVSLFVNPPGNPLTGSANDLWYTRSASEGVNRPVPHADLTAFLLTLYRRESFDRAGTARPRLDVHLQADKRYILQTGFYTNFASSLLAALVALPPEAFGEPLTFKVEQTPGRNSHPTTFCQVIWRGERTERTPDSQQNKAHLATLSARYGFRNPLAS